MISIYLQVRWKTIFEVVFKEEGKRMLDTGKSMQQSHFYYGIIFNYFLEEQDPVFKELIYYC